MHARTLLGQLYEAAGKPRSAARQYRQVRKGSFRIEWRDQAREFFEKTPSLR